MKVRGAAALICMSFLATTEGCKEDETPEIPFVKEEYVYKTVTIGTQEWMAEDLKNNCFCNGEPIPQVKLAGDWASLKKAGWSYVYFNHNEEKLTWGKLYNWYAVYDERNICPCGWHVPSYDDLVQLITFLGGEEKAGGMMKTTGTFPDSRWPEPNAGATNSSGFSGEPKGARNPNGAFELGSFNAVWWISDGVYINPESPVFALHNINAELTISPLEKKYGIPVRCIKD